MYAPLAGAKTEEALNADLSPLHRILETGDAGAGLKDSVEQQRTVSRSVTSTCVANIAEGTTYAQDAEPCKPTEELAKVPVPTLGILNQNANIRTPKGVPEDSNGLLRGIWDPLLPETPYDPNLDFFDDLNMEENDRKNMNQCSPMQRFLGGRGPWNHLGLSTYSREEADTKNIPYQ